MRHTLLLRRSAARSVQAAFVDARPRSRGQSVVEFALVLPLILLLTLVALDFGRIYLGYINLQNMTRVAANFAANNPTAWLTNDTATIAKYQNQVLDDATASNCQLNPATPVAPTFTDANGDGISTGIGDYATVKLTCVFQVVTPFISSILGGSVNVSASAVFPVKAGITGTGGAGTSCILPSPAINAAPSSGAAPLTVNFSDASGGGAGTSWLWDFGDGTPTSTLRDPGNHIYTTGPKTYTVTLTVTNACGTVSTVPGVTITVGSSVSTLCTVPVLDGLQAQDAQAAWGLPKPPGAGFTTLVQKGNGNFTIKSQSIVAGSVADCGSSITVANK
jgi:PKD repeat protein